VSANARWIEIDTVDGKLQGYLSLPPTGKGPGIILFQEIFGVNEHIRGVADLYAKAGYVVLAPDVFWRSQPRVELGYVEPDMSQAVGLMQQVDISKTLADVAATAKVLRNLPEVTGKIAAIGYCFGGQLAYLSAAEGLVDAAVAYYGGGIQNKLDQAAKISVPIVFHYGEKDSHIPLDAVEQVKASFAGRNNAKFYLYPDAEHGFNCWARGSYQQKASAVALGRTLQFLAETL
jgi:carboxymethylenebutenolidase